MAVAKVPVEKLFSGLEKIKAELENIIKQADSFIDDASAYGGEISRVSSEQMNKYFIPYIRKIIEDENTPGAIIPLVHFLDSVPLAATREEPVPEVPPVENPEAGTQIPVGTKETSEEEAQETTTQEEIMAPVATATPAQKTDNAVDLQQSQSADAIPENQVHESRKPLQGKILEKKITGKKLKEEIIVPNVKYLVVRESNCITPSQFGRNTGKKGYEIVAEFENVEEAQERARWLDRLLTESDRSFFGTTYKVYRHVFNKNLTEPKAEESKADAKILKKEEK